MLTSPLSRWKPILSLMEVGFCFWRLLVLPLAGLFFALMISIDFFPHDALFFSSLLFTVWYVAFDFRNRLFGKDTVSLLTLWPISPFKKALWIQLRGTWLPTFLLFLGTLLGFQLTGTDLLALGVHNFLVVLSGAALIGILSWQGRFYAIDGGALVGKVSSRQKNGLAMCSLLIACSPMLLTLFPKSIAFVLCAFYAGMVYVLSSKHRTQIGGGFVRENKTSKTVKEATFYSSIKSPFTRYYCYLEFDFFRNPLGNWLIFFTSSCFIVVFYYLLSNLFIAPKIMTAYQNSLFIGLLIPYFTFYLSNTADFEEKISSIEMLMPLPRGQIYMADLAKRFVRPFFYTFIGVVPIVSVIYVTNLVLSKFIELPPILYGQMIWVTLTSSLSYLPFVLFTLSAWMLLSKLKFIANRLSHLSFIPIFILGLALSKPEGLRLLKAFLTPTMIVIQLFLFIFFELILYWRSGKIQVSK